MIVSAGALHGRYLVSSYSDGELPSVSFPCRLDPRESVNGDKFCKEFPLGQPKFLLKASGAVL